MDKKVDNHLANLSEKLKGLGRSKIMSASGDEAMQKHPRESDATEIGQQLSTSSAFKQEIAFVSNPQEGRRYAGQWVALAGCQVVAAGHRPKQVLAEAEERGYKDPLLHYFPLRDPDTMFLGRLVLGGC